MNLIDSISKRLMNYKIFPWHYLLNISMLTVGKWPLKFLLIKGLACTESKRT
jgi:hypothetical protein